MTAQSLSTPRISLEILLARSEKDPLPVSELVGPIEEGDISGRHQRFTWPAAFGYLQARSALTAHGRGLEATALRQVTTRPRYKYYTSLQA